MNTLKPLAIIAVLAAIGVGLYRNINGGSATDSSDDFADMWGEVPTVVMPGDGTATPSDAPPFGASTTGVPSSVWNSPPEASAAAPVTSSAPLPGATAVPPVPGTTVPGTTPWGDRAAASGGPTAMNPTAMNPTAMNPTAMNPSAVPWAGGVLTGTAVNQYGSAGIAPSGQPDLDVSASVAVPVSTAFADLRTTVQSLLDRGKLAESLFLLSDWYGDPSLAPADKIELVDLLGRLAGTVIYSREHYLEGPYFVQPGDTLQSISEQFQVPSQFLAKINGVAPSAALNPGRELKVVRGPFSAIVNLTDRELTLILNGRYAGRFSIGVGQDLQQIEGRWLVQQKQLDPTYYGPNRTIDADDPQNPLGEHMLGLARAYGASPTEVFGIHGTNDASSIARDDPSGFIRLAPADVEDVFDILSIGSRVMIRR